MKCAARNCDGEVDTNNRILVNVQQRGAEFVFACVKCGKLHRENGAEALSCTEHSLFYRNGTVCEGSKGRGYPVH